MDMDSVEVKCRDFLKCTRPCEFILRLMKLRTDVGVKCEVRCIASTAQTMVWTE